MKMAGPICLILLVAFVGFAASSSKEEFERWEDAMVKHVCSHADGGALIKEIVECEKSYPDDVHEPFLKCQEETDTFKYLQEGCKDDAALQQYYACLGANFENEEFRKQILNSKETLDCLLNAFKAHGIESDELVLKDQ